MRRYSPSPASPRGIDRKAEGGAAGGVRHRMIALIRADGRLGKRAVWFVSRGWPRVNLRGVEVDVAGRRLRSRSRYGDGSAADESARAGRTPCETQPPGVAAAATPTFLPATRAVIELSLSFDFEETHQSVVRGALKRAEKLLPIRGVIAII